MKFSNTINSKYFQKIENLKSQSLKSGFWSVISQFFNFSFKLISLSVLSRILNPEDFGLIAMCTTISGFVTVFSDIGLTTSTIQSDNLDSQKFNSVYILNFLIGILLTILFVFISPIMAWFYNDDRLLLIGIFSSLSFFLSGISSQYLALLKKIMEFKTLAIATIIASLIELTICLLLAKLGYGYWALIFGILANGLFLAIFLTFKFKWYPSKFIWSDEIKSFLHFGKFITFFDVINYFSKNLDNILIGKFKGAVILGFYSRAYQIMSLPLSQIRIPFMAVVLPSLSQLKNDEVKYKDYYNTFISIFRILITYIVLLMWVNSESIVLIMLGEKWGITTQIFSILAIASFFQPIYGTFGTVLISLGKSKKYFYWGIYNAIIIIVSFIIGVNYSITLFSWFYVLANIITYFFSAFFTLKNTPINVIEFHKKNTLFIFFFIIIGFFFRKYAIDFSNILYNLLYRSTIITMFFILYLVFFKKDRMLIKKAFSLLRRK
ncbi:lipopolysaccharide biosynthesis protein [Flavobacterium sp.]|uniref:lipopolysaccharide biosynthesis protein n=1 Tax=Flavobacterium sp. TaxID=239 RepID=UPI003F6A367B